MAVLLGASVALADGVRAASRARPRPPACTAGNFSTPTRCAEEDNVNVPLSSPVVRAFAVEATHPRYPVGMDSCREDFTDCPTSGGPTYPSTPTRVKLFDDGVNVVEAVREASWWRPRAMSVAVDAGRPVGPIHYLRIYRRIPGLNEWPQFFVLYADGNMRLIPHPPLGRSSVCFGSSVIVGPAANARRPLAEIASARYLSRSRVVKVTYRRGGSADIRIVRVDRAATRVVVDVNYRVRGVPFATFRSMFVEPGNADVDRVRWRDASGVLRTQAILSFRRGRGFDWQFFRRDRSRHNTSAPDIRIAPLR